MFTYTLIQQHLYILLGAQHHAIGPQTMATLSSCCQGSQGSGFHSVQGWGVAGQVRRNNGFFTGSWKGWGPLKTNLFSPWRLGFSLCPMMVLNWASLRHLFQGLATVRCSNSCVWEKSFGPCIVWQQRQLAGVRMLRGESRSVGHPRSVLYEKESP